MLGKDTLLLVPVGAGPFLRKRGFGNVVELPSATHVHHGVSITATYAVHDGKGWTTAYNVWTGNGGAGSICGDDTTSLYRKTVKLQAPGPPAYDDHLADCAQPGSALVPPKVSGGRPKVDADGELLPPKWLAGAGADQCDTSLMVLGRSIGAVRLGKGVGPSGSLWTAEIHAGVSFSVGTVCGSSRTWHIGATSGFTSTPKAPLLGSARAVRTTQPRPGSRSGARLRRSLRVRGLRC